jgi:hypothetical protein
VSRCHDPSFARRDLRSLKIQLPDFTSFDNPYLREYVNARLHAYIADQSEAWFERLCHRSPTHYLVRLLWGSASLT